MEKETYTILCIDDEESILKTLNRLLRREGYKIYTATSGEEGLEILGKEKIDLILCDQRMPTMNGFEVLRIARKEYPETMRIMLSGYSDFDNLVKTINEGEIFRFLSKPWDMEELKNVIRSALEQKEIICEVKNLFGNIKSIGQLIENISVEPNQGQTAVTVKIASKKNPYNPGNINQFLEYIFKVLELDGTQQFKIISNSVIKEKDFLKFELILGKGIKLIIEIEMKELNKE